MLEAQIQKAMQRLQVVHFFYDGHIREVEPHVLGIHGGVPQLLGFQIGGSSRSGYLPNWRRFDLYSISGLVTTDARFSGPRPTRTGRHAPFDHLIEVVH